MHSAPWIFSVLYLYHLWFWKASMNEFQCFAKSRHTQFLNPSESTDFQSCEDVLVFGQMPNMHWSPPLWYLWDQKSKWNRDSIINHIKYENSKKRKYKMRWVGFESSKDQFLKYSNEIMRKPPVIYPDQDSNSTHAERNQTLRKILSCGTKFEVGTSLLVECMLCAFDSVHLNQLE